MDFVEFVGQRSTALLRTAYVLTGDRHAAEDLVQEALERACRKWRRIQAMDSPEAYVRQIVVNLANDRWRTRGRAPQVVADPDRPAPGDAYQRVDERDALFRALQALPMGMRTVVVLRYFHDMGDEQIAAMLHVSANTVRSQLARGLSKLRDTSRPISHVPHAGPVTAIEGS